MYKNESQLERAKPSANMYGPKRHLPRILAWVFAVVALLFIKNIEDRSTNPEKRPSNDYRSFFSTEFVYQQMVGKAKPPASFVRLVVISRESLKKTTAAEERSKSQVCAMRMALARLLNRLARVSPKVVVLDMWFEPDSCSDKDSQPLWSSLENLSRNVPVVIGIGSDNLFEAISDHPAELSDIVRRGAKLKSTELVSRASVDLSQMDAKNFTRGVVELDEDSRKMPLSWPIYQSYSSVGRPKEPERVDSLSIAAIRAYEPQNSGLRRVGALSSDGLPVRSTSYFPYANFLEEPELPIFSAEDVICSRYLDPDPVCITGDADSFDPRGSFTGKIVLVGYAGLTADVHDSAIGNVPGVVLQANYVESMLDDRVYLPVPILYQALFLAVWLGVLFSIPVFVHGKGWALLALALAMILPSYGIHLFIVWSKYYTPLLSTLIVTGLLLFLTKKIESILESEGDTQ